MVEAILADVFGNEAANETDWNTVDAHFDPADDLASDEDHVDDGGDLSPVDDIEAGVEDESTPHDDDAFDEDHVDNGGDLPHADDIEVGVEDESMLDDDWMFDEDAIDG